MSLLAKGGPIRATNRRNFDSIRPHTYGVFFVGNIIAELFKFLMHLLKGYDALPEKHVTSSQHRNPSTGSAMTVELEWNTRDRTYS